MRVPRTEGQSEAELGFVSPHPLLLSQYHPDPVPHLLSQESPRCPLHKEGFGV